MTKKGLTLMEILTSSVIFALVIAGLANIFVAGKRYILHSRSRMAGGEIGKYFIDPLQMDVRQDTWGQSGNKLTPAPPYKGTPQTINRIVYTPQYNITNVAGTNLRRAVITLTWNETSP